MSTKQASRAQLTLGPVRRVRLEVQLSELGVRRLPMAEAFWFFRRHASCDRARAAHTPLAGDAHLEYFVG